MSQNNTEHRIHNTEKLCVLTTFLVPAISMIFRRIFVSLKTEKKIPQNVDWKSIFVVFGQGECGFLDISRSEKCLHQKFNERPLTPTVLNLLFSLTLPIFVITDYGSVRSPELLHGVNLLFLVHSVRGTLWRSWLRHCAGNRKVAGSIPDDVTGIFHWHNPSGCTMTLGLTLPLTEMSTRNDSKVVGSLGWQPYHFQVPIVLKSWILNLLEPSGPVLYILSTSYCNGKFPRYFVEAHLGADIRLHSFLPWTLAGC
jgi:hypothetical protein